MTRLPYAVAGLMAIQAVTGLLFRQLYRDVDWIKLAWIGNDAVTLLVAVPLLVGSCAAAAHGSARGQLTTSGVLGFAVYNSAFYLFGARLSAFFLLYVAVFVMSTLALVTTLLQSHRRTTRRPLRSGRWPGAGLLVVGAGLAIVWITFWAGYVFAGWPTPIEPDAFRLVAALDLSLLVPGLVAGGILLWLHRPLGNVVGPSMSIMASLYLLVLSVNSFLALRSGNGHAAFELLIWVPLLAVMAAIAVSLVATASPRLSVTRQSARPATSH